MPRVTYTSNEKIWADPDNPNLEPFNECMDFCAICYKKGKYKDYVPQNVPANFIYEEDIHPDYEEQWPHYKCRACKKELKETDN